MASGVSASCLTESQEVPVPSASSPNEESPPGVSGESQRALSQFPIENLSQFPIENLSQFPMGNLSQFPMENLSQLVQGSLSQLALPIESTILHSCP